MPEDQREEDVRARMEELHAPAFGWALSCCGWDRPLAEDALQSSYLKVLEGKARFGGRSTFKTWFFEVIRRTAAEQRRRRALRRFVPMEEVGHLIRSTAAGPEEELNLSEGSSRLIGAMKMLPKRQREVLHLVFYADLTIREAAEVLGVSLGTARTHYERGKTRLRELLKEEER